MSVLTASISCLFTVEKIDFLKSHKIVTSLDFLQFNNDKLKNIMGITVSEIISIKEKILELNNCKPMRADRLCDTRLQTTLLLSSGIKLINFLGVEFLLDQLQKFLVYQVTYLTSSDLKAKGILNLLQRFYKGHTKNLEESLERIDFTPVFDVYQLMEAIWNLCSTSHYQLVIIDSFASLFMQIFGDSSNDAISLLNKVASDLKRLAILNRCSIFLVNHSAKQKLDSTTATPALGRYWLTVPNLRLHSRRLNQSEIEFTIVRNIYCPYQDEKCTIVIKSD